jgi:hypothetical protein
VRKSSFVAVLLSFLVGSMVFAQGGQAPPQGPQPQQASPSDQNAEPQQVVVQEDVVLTANVNLTDVARLEPGSRTGTQGLVLTSGGQMADAITLPPNFGFPANHCLQQAVVIRSGATIPKGTLVAAGSTLPDGVTLPPKRVAIIPGIVEIPADRAATAEELTVAAQVYGLTQQRFTNQQVQVVEQQANLAGQLTKAIEMLEGIDGAVGEVRTDVGKLNERVGKVEGSLAGLKKEVAETRAKADAAAKAAAERRVVYQQPSCSTGNCGGGRRGFFGR